MTRLTAFSLVGLGAGIAIGIALASSDGGPGGLVLGAAAATVRAWTNAFRVLVVPLVVSQLYLTIAAAGSPASSLGRLSVLALGVFAGLLIGTTVVAVLTAPLLMQFPWVRDISLVAEGASAPTGAANGGEAPGTWVDAFVPPNLIAAAAGDGLLPLMLFTVVFAVAIRRVEAAPREALARVLEAIRAASFIVVEWLLAVTPLVVFALGIDAASRSGLLVGEVLLAFVLVEVALLVLAVLLLYPVAIASGPYGPGELSRAVLPAQLTAITTRSSLATLPALLTAARALRVPEPVAAYVVPLAGSTLKLSRAVSNPTKLIFLATLLAVPLDARTVLVFIATVLLLSPSEIGVPRVTSGTRSMPAYVAAGIPPQYVVLLGAATAVTDVLLTLLNTMGYFTATLVSARLLRGREAVER
jgi:Na+/H+-dicarboxylate symporter